MDKRLCFHCHSKLTQHIACIALGAWSWFLHYVQLNKKIKKYIQQIFVTIHEILTYIVTEQVIRMCWYFASILTIQELKSTC